MGDLHGFCSCSTPAGFHYINLKNELNQPLLLPSLLVYTEAQDYIPNEHQGTPPTGGRWERRFPTRLIEPQV